MSELFKEKCNEKTSYEDNIRKLIDSIKNNNVKELLFGNTDLKTIESHPDRTECKGFKNHATRGKDGEKRICKCLFYKNTNNVKTNCNNCILKNQYKIIDGKYYISNYEIPAFYTGTGIGEIDLILSDGTKNYATEVKPHVKTEKDSNNETLLRMIAEIMTYTYGFEDGKYEKAIGFFENTTQHKEYIENNELIKELIDLANIHVFLFSEVETNHGAYKITKIY